MKTKLLIVLAGLVAFVGCNKKTEIAKPAEDTGKVAFTVSFEAAPGVKAAKSTAIPKTSWENVKTLQFFLYDASKKVKYAYQTTSLPNTVGGKKTFTYTDVPVGTYTLVAVANANPAQNVTTFVGGVEMTWNSFNVREKLVNTMFIKHKSGSFPSFVTMSGSNHAFVEPGEIFMDSKTGVTISNGNTTTVSDIKLKREVSMLRARINVKDTDAGVHNTQDASDGVDWTKNVSIMVYRLPEHMLPMNGNDGGVSTNSNKNNILVAEGQLKTSDPDGTKYNPTKIIDGNFTMWNDIIVFPNNNGRVDSDVSGNATVDRQYYIVVSAQGKKDHVLADGTKLTAPTTIYWRGLAKGKFSPNIIREVNLTLKSGGQKEVPTEPGQEGTLIVEMGDPVAWNANIQTEDITL